jgi:hypothetical protein
VPVEQLDVARPGIAIGQTPNRAEEVIPATRALQVVEDLDRDRRVGRAEAIAFLWHAAKDFLGFRDSGEVDDVPAGLLGGDADDRVADRPRRYRERQHDPDPAPARDLDDGRLGSLLLDGGGHRLIIPGSPPGRRSAFDTSALRGKYLPTHFQLQGRSAVANHLTPSELAEELHMKRQDVIGKCVQMGIPIFHGRIDRSLFETSLRSMTGQRQRHEVRPN